MPKPAQSTDELRQQLEKILKDTHTNGVSVAIVRKGGPEWVTSLVLPMLPAGGRPPPTRCSVSDPRRKHLRHGKQIVPASDIDRIERHISPCSGRAIPPCSEKRVAGPFSF